MSRARWSQAFAVVSAVLVLAVALGLGGCSQITRVTKVLPVTPSVPVADSPTGVVELFRWCWVNRSVERYRELFTSDFVFTFAATDSAGNAYREDHPWRREDELLCAERLFVGGGSEPPATSITLDFGSALMAYPDTRPGKNARWHKKVNVGIVLLIDRPTSDFEVKGDLSFYVVRGDSAHIPDDLGLSPDSTRWYIQGIEDYTFRDASAAPGALAPQPARSTSLGQVKVLYRPSAPASPPVGTH